MQSKEQYSCEKKKKGDLDKLNKIRIQIKPWIKLNSVTGFNQLANWFVFQL